MILASSEEEYKDYADCIRKEYSHYSDNDFCIGRKKVMQGLLDNPAIFSSVKFRKFEIAARNNITKEITEWLIIS